MGLVFSKKATENPLYPATSHGGSWYQSYRPRVKACWDISANCRWEARARLSNSCYFVHGCLCTKIYSKLGKRSPSRGRGPSSGLSCSLSDITCSDNAALQAGWRERAGKRDRFQRGKLPNSAGLSKKSPPVTKGKGRTEGDRKRCWVEESRE